MKRMKDLSTGFGSMAWCYEVIMKASKGKRRRRDVAKVLRTPFTHAFELRKMLMEESYEPSPWSTTERKDGRSGKVRQISQVPFWPDQCVHWALVTAVQPALMRGMFPHSCGNIPGRGQHHGIKFVKKWLRCKPAKTKYCLQMDVTKFYQNVNQDLLLGMLGRKVKDGKVLRLSEKVIKSYPSGLPIGSYVSQWYANFYLEGFDHFLSEQMEAKHYIRFVDDMIILDSDKQKLHEIRKAADSYLASIGLSLKSNWQVYEVDKRGIDFLGYVFKHGKTSMRGRNFLTLRRKIAKLEKRIASTDQIPFTLASSLLSMFGQFKWWDSFTFQSKYIKPKRRVFLKQIVNSY